MCVCVCLFLCLCVDCHQAWCDCARVCGCMCVAAQYTYPQVFAAHVHKMHTRTPSTHSPTHISLHTPTRAYIPDPPPSADQFTDLHDRFRASIGSAPLPSRTPQCTGSAHDHISTSEKGQSGRQSGFGSKEGGVCGPFGVAPGVKWDAGAQAVQAKLGNCDWERQERLGCVNVCVCAWVCVCGCM